MGKMPRCGAVPDSPSPGTSRSSGPLSRSLACGSDSPCWSWAGVSGSESERSELSPDGVVGGSRGGSGGGAPPVGGSREGSREVRGWFGGAATTRVRSGSTRADAGSTRCSFSRWRRARPRVAFVPLRRSIAASRLSSCSQRLPWPSNVRRTRNRLSGMMTNNAGSHRFDSGHAWSCGGSLRHWQAKAQAAPRRHDRHGVVASGFLGVVFT